MLLCCAVLTCSVSCIIVGLFRSAAVYAFCASSGDSRFAYTMQKCNCEFLYNCRMGNEFKTMVCYLMSYDSVDNDVSLNRYWLCFQVTSHIQGMFNRTIRMLSKGVKPCYIFDGKPPQLKGGEVRTSFISLCTDVAHSNVRACSPSVLRPVTV